MSDAHLIRAHQAWLGFLQQQGLVVAARALVDAQAILETNAIADQRRLDAVLLHGKDEDERLLPSFRAFATQFLGWDEAALVYPPDLPDTLDVVLTDFDETLRPNCGVKDPDATDANWLLLVSEEERNVDLDRPREAAGKRWHASPQARFERLLRETGVPVGILTNGSMLRLVYAPKGESTGHLTFPVTVLTGTSGRDCVAALLLLLGREHLYAGPVPENRRLHALLRSSRRYQNDVSEELAEQVLDALWELLRGFQSANEATKGELLREILEKEPQSVYGGLLGTLMRLVFVLYAEDRGLMPQGEVYAKNYSIGGLFERLRDDHATFPETMDQRYGAWAHLLTLFRLIHDGGAHGGLKLPPRHGHLFDPDTWDFLEGRPYGDQLDRGKAIDTPKVPDSTIYRVLDKMIFLKGERISYRTLDVEEIGSVYEAMMGFELREAEGPSVAVKPKDIVVDLAKLLADKPDARLKRLTEDAECKVEGKVAAAIKAASSIADLTAALGKKLSRRTPNPVPDGGLFLQPTAERRRSGSHYTPRSLTKPIVETTLRPILAGLSHPPKPEEILALKVCDSAMGSGAFLVETCRYLAEALIDGWRAHGGTPTIQMDEDPLVHAQRLVATRCLYGVDKNRFAVDLAKLSLWLATLAKDHPFTFLDHSLRHGDSLVGLTRAQITSFNWEPGQDIFVITDRLAKALKVAEAKREAIHVLGDGGDTGEKARLHSEAFNALSEVRDAGDLVIAAFFDASSAKERNALCRQSAADYVSVIEGKGSSETLERAIQELRTGPRPVPPFHWEIEFPEVFSRENPGFDAFVGNPPFAGKNTVAVSTRGAYPDWLTLKRVHPQSHGNADLVAHFFRRAFNLLRQGGVLGLIATNTIAQGDTRSTGLRWICLNGGTIYSAQKRYKWPGKAAVVVSVIHIARGSGFDRSALRPFLLDGEEVPQITAFLFHDGGHEDPVPLRANAGKSFIGSYVLGMGFTFDDTNPDASTIAEMHRLTAKSPHNSERILPYIGGEEVNDSPTHEHRRYVINFANFPLRRDDLDGKSWSASDGDLRAEWLRSGVVPRDYPEPVATDWPDLVTILETKVKPDRMKNNRDGYWRYWWQHAEKRADLYPAVRGLARVLVIARVSQFHAPAFLPRGPVFSEQLVVVAVGSYAAYATLQARPHENWFRFFGSSLEERPRYTPSDCFETFPFPRDWESSTALETAGRGYYNFRAALMARNDEGLTKTYNRFHDPDERDPDILKLREHHAAMDRAVLDAYGWTDLHPTCEFLLDYEEEESDDPSAPKSKKKKPWRYRWPDAFRDEVLARLLALNAERAAEEALAGPVAPKPKVKESAATKPPKKKPGTMFEE